MIASISNWSVYMGGKMTLSKRLILGAWLLGVVITILSGPAQAEDKSPPYILTSDEPSGIYASGRDIVFTVRPGKGRTMSDLERASVKVIFNGLSDFATGKTMGDGVLSLRLKPSLPGWYRCEVSGPAVSNAPATASAGVLVSPADIKPAASPPMDFDAFWTAKRSAVESAPLKFQFKPVHAEQHKDIMEYEKAGYECFDVCIELPVANVRPVRGFMARPKGAKLGSCPAIISFKAAGVSGSWCLASAWWAMTLSKDYGAIVLDLNAHGIPNDQPQAYYQQLEKGDLYDYAAQGKGKRDTFYFVGMYQRLMQSINFVCAQKEWDGKHLVCIGESQGGGQALAAAGLDQRVTAVSAIVPALCDLSGSLANRSAGWPNPLGGRSGSMTPKEVAAAIGYCDNVYLASRSKAETQIFAGLIDTVCPPHGIFAAFNNLQGKKRYYVYPHKFHSGLPGEDLWIGDINTLQRAFIKQAVGK